MTNISVDTETLGTQPGCSILSIGAVEFNSEGLGDTFYTEISMKSCQDAGLFIDADTNAWWHQQSPKAREIFTKGRKKTTLLGAITSFKEFWTAQSGAQFWCHGAIFDEPILRAAFQAVAVSPPWDFWNVRDTRTLYEAAGVSVNRDEGTHHNALADAEAQAEAIIEAWEKLGIKVP